MAAPLRHDTNEWHVKKGVYIFANRHMYWRWYNAYITTSDDEEPKEHAPATNTKAGHGIDDVNEKSPSATGIKMANNGEGLNQRMSPSHRKTANSNEEQQLLVINHEQPEDISDQTHLKVPDKRPPNDFGRVWTRFYTD